MVSLKEIKKTLKELKTLREQKEYLEGILKAVKDDKILAKAVEVFLNEVTRMIEQEKRDIPHKTIDDVLSLVKGPEEEEELKLPEKSVKEVLRETRDYHTSEVKEVKGEAYVPAPKGVSYSPSSTSGVSYSGSRQDRIESVRAYMRDVKRMTDNLVLLCLSLGKVLSRWLICMIWLRIPSRLPTHLKLEKL